MILNCPHGRTPVLIGYSYNSKETFALSLSVGDCDIVVTNYSTVFKKKTSIIKKTMKGATETPIRHASSADDESKVYEGRNGIGRFVARSYLCRRTGREMIRWREIGPCSRLDKADCRLYKDTCKLYNNGRCTRIPQRRSVKKAMANLDTAKEQLERKQQEADRTWIVRDAAERAWAKRKTPEGKQTASEKVDDLTEDLDDQIVEIEQAKKNVNKQKKQVAEIRRQSERLQRKNPRRNARRK